MTPEQAFGACLKYVRETLEGAGAVRGVPCELESIDEQEDAFVMTYKWEEKDGSVHRQEMLIPKPHDLTQAYDYDEILVGSWVNGEPLYRKVFTITENLAKDNTIKVCAAIPGMIKMVRGFGIVETQFGSYSNNDITIYSATDGIFVKQNFTSYPKSLDVIIEYTKAE